MEIEKLVAQATRGDKKALERITEAIQNNVYSLALRMLVNPEDAKDATQEILIKIITNLSSFRFKSQFTTWVYSVAANYLISEKKLLSKELGLTFDRFKEDLENGLHEPTLLQDDPSYQTLLNELRISCTMAMLLCLKPDHRMAYILGDIYEMEHIEASEILQISKDNFRQQLSRARAKVIGFTSKNCGLVNSCAKCSCERKITDVHNKQCITVNNIYFTSDKQYSYKDVKASLLLTQQSLKSLALQQSINHHECPVDLSAMITSLVTDALKSNKALQHVCQ
ncbi:hypothetical protein tinsulaeT_06570 [Thalassotalea insulae]|uniref:RNA polymerase sigma factor n=1 Tax=Thalassotalea insulae TaxID=2056778 RepID=A0ABQ6GPL7_9GAMM|nr:RNA polymerase sigma factor [Thalassotalea insulae]GLX77317.1 hypothetical protein tinsulaeT_06570 [Thalassotalea insulae]